MGKRTAAFCLWARWERTLHKRIVITNETINGCICRITALFEENLLTEVSCEEQTVASILGNVYIGRVRQISEKIQAAFVEIAPGEMTYLPLKEAKNAWMTRQTRPGRLTQEDEIVVQVAKEAIKSKDPMVSTNITIRGNALILTAFDRRLGISKKLDDASRGRLKALFLQTEEEPFGLIVRTGAKQYEDAQLLAEYESLRATYYRLYEQHQHRTCYSCLYQEPSGYIATVRDHLSAPPEKIVTDDPLVYEALKEAFCDTAGVLKNRIVFYEDPLLSLSALYSLKSKLKEALLDRVWLKSGAYLIIQPTEALTVIDVNSGGSAASKKEDFHLKVNLEAAKEIARQLRLRNISGICIVDFISMEAEESKNTLIQAFKRHLLNDRVRTDFVDFTKLDLAEITRKKIKKPLWEQLPGRKPDASLQDRA